jgi:hypothetical protein
MLNRSLHGKFACIGRGRSAWCAKPNSANPLIQRHQGFRGSNVCKEKALVRPECGTNLPIS